MNGLEPNSEYIIPEILNDLERSPVSLIPEIIDS